MKPLAFLDDRSTATKWLVIYALYFAVLHPLIVWSAAVIVGEKTFSLVGAYWANVVSHAIFVAFAVAHVVGALLARNAELAKMTYEAKAAMPGASPAQEREHVTTFMNTPPTNGADLQAERRTVTATDMMGYVKANQQYLSLAEAQRLLSDAGRTRDWMPVRGVLLNIIATLKRDASTTGESPSPTHSFSL